ncbi:MAG: hypothetical protein AAF492_28970 [Verrucomicrobiota bacterium]
MRIDAHWRFIFMGFMLSGIPAFGAEPKPEPAYIKALELIEIKTDFGTVYLAPKFESERKAILATLTELVEKSRKQERTLFAFSQEKDRFIRRMNEILGHEPDRATLEKQAWVLNTFGVNQFMRFATRQVGETWLWKDDEMAK